MKLKLFKSDGTETGEYAVENFPSLENGKGSDALRQVILAVRANQRQGNASTNFARKYLDPERKSFVKRV